MPQINLLIFVHMSITSTSSATPIIITITTNISIYYITKFYV